MAIQLNSLGAFLILSSRNKSSLLQVKSGCAHPEKVEILPCDLDETAHLASISRQAWGIFNGIDYVFLNAGMAVRDLVLNTELEMVNKVMTTNFFSNVAISKSLLPHMIQRGRGHFIVTSSICGKFGVPKLSAYSASKHALHGFYDSLRSEYENLGIAVTIITSGLVRTNITLNALTGNGGGYGRMQESIANGISPDSCADQILKAAARRKREALIGGIEIYGVLIRRFFPGLFAWAISRHPMKKMREVKKLFRDIFSSRTVGKSYTRSLVPVQPKN
jgi:short-subunit dehydrogenase